MTRAALDVRPFIPGSTGWSAADLDDPHVEREWFSGHYEIIEGVLTTMPAAYFAGHVSLENLVFLLKSHLKSKGLPSAFAQDVDVILDETRVVRCDMVYLTKQDRARQARAARLAGKTDVRRARIYVPPTLVIESLSPGHERHDEGLKRKWYAAFGVPNYWLLNAFDHTLRCLALRDGAYRADASGRGKAKLRPASFPGLAVSLADVWEGSDPDPD